MEKIDKNIEIAKRIITEEIEKAGYKVERIVLFGSRARGDYKEGSDYDFLVAINRDISRDKKLDLTWHIRRRLARYIASDIIIKYVNKLVKEKDDKGLISYYALKEGMTLG
ncbi:MAG: nucleotidyltransferase domain-containing protein [Deltaproteobacteria bacterium]|jgi:predicted nucleotidyltransferase|nr:nucleotidyltransferase domain-containing protein [Deltaproteobacteria bacterium]MCL5891990.1 nucleotidyltransferase domain-containing protein [Deltaproteobacteria bacterium]